MLTGLVQQKIEFSFKPDSVGPFSTTAHFRSREAGERTSTLKGCGELPTSVTSNGYATSLSKGSTEYSELSSRLDRGEQLVILPPVPNPAARGSNISIRFVYGLNASEPLKLSLFDLLGKEVAVIFDDNHPAGIYETRFAVPRNLPDGSYIYRLASESKVLSGKLVILH
ncbi:MAG: T9SS type A sorting domain-containing protein [Candidatus Kapaibacterium sp.]